MPETSAFRMRYERKQELEHAREGRSEALGASPDALDGVGAPAAKQGNLSSLFEPRALAGALPVMVISPTFGFGIFFVGLYGTELGAESASFFYTIAAVSMIVVRLKSGAFMDRVVPIKIFTVAVVCGLVTTAMLFFAAVSDWIFYLSGISYGLCLGLAMPVNQSVAVKNTPSDRWGAANGLFFAGTGLGDWALKRALGRYCRAVRVSSDNCPGGMLHCGVVCNCLGKLSQTRQGVEVAARAQFCFMQKSGCSTSVLLFAF